MIVHRQALSAAECVSARQCLAVLGPYPIHVVAPEGLMIPDMLRHLPAIRFPATFFDSIKGYNRLMLSPVFYEAFRDYSHVLIHQLDVFVFRDELREWCVRDYDYIGAPWLGMKLPDNPELKKLLTPYAHTPDTLARRYGVGNGGFSLRRVPTMLKALKALREVREMWADRHEDAFWGIAVPTCAKTFDFHLPDETTAMAFAFETQPDQCFRQLGKLPFGCHAWNKIAPAFWRPHIRAAGYKVYVPGDGSFRDRIGAIAYRARMAFGQIHGRPISLE